MSLGPATLTIQDPQTGRFSPVVRWLAVAFVVAGAFGWYEADKHWPYRYRNVEPLLESLFASQIKIDRYHRIYWPHPGFVAEGLTLRRNAAPDLPPLGSADQLIVQGSWRDLLLLRRRVLLVEVKGMHVVIPPVGSRANHEDFPPGSAGDFTGPKTAVETMHLADATLDLMQDSGGRLRFPIRDLRIHDLKTGAAVRYEVDMDNARPVGQLLAEGSFGPLRAQHLGDTPLAGHFRFGPVDLSQIGGLHGLLRSEGEFSGTLASVETAAKQHTVGFAVGGGAPVELDGAVRCRIDGLNGDVLMERVDVRTGETTVSAAGSVAGSPKVTEVDLQVDGGRAQDLLHPFLKHRPPVVGGVWLRSHAHLDPAAVGLGFFDRLKMDGRFEIPREKLTSRKTEKSLTAFSERAQGGHESADEAAPEVLSSLDGAVEVRHGVAVARQLHFAVPGADARLDGTYGLRDGAASLEGTLRMDSDLSHVTTGWKALMLKPLAPFFHKKGAAAEVPIKVTGRPGSYKVGANLFHKK